MSHPLLRFDVTIEYVYRCAECGAEERTVHPHARMQLMMLPCPPVGWTVVNGRVFCPIHELTVDVRGKDGIRTVSFDLTGEI